MILANSVRVRPFLTRSLRALNWKLRRASGTVLELSKDLKNHGIRINKSLSEHQSQLSVTTKITKLEIGKDSDNFEANEPSIFENSTTFDLDSKIQDSAIEQCPELEICRKKDNSLDKIAVDANSDVSSIMAGLYPECKLLLNAALTQGKSTYWQTLAGRKSHICFMTPQVELLPIIDTFVSNLIMKEFPKATVLNIDANLLADIALLKYRNSNNNQDLSTFLLRRCYNSEWSDDDLNDLESFEEIAFDHKQHTDLRYPSIRSKPTQVKKNYMTFLDTKLLDQIPFSKILPQPIQFKSKKPQDTDLNKKKYIEKTLRALISSIIDLPQDIARYHNVDLSFQKNPLIIRLPAMLGLLGIDSLVDNEEGYGINIIHLIEEMILEKRLEGQKIIMIGSLLTSHASKDTYQVRNLEHSLDFWESYYLPIIDSDAAWVENSIMYDTTKANLRHLQRALAARDCSTNLNVCPLIDELMKDDTFIKYNSKKWDSVIVERIASALLGHEEYNGNLGQDITIKIINLCSENVDRYYSSLPEDRDFVFESDDAASYPNSPDERDTYRFNQYEQKLQSNIFDPKTINTRFDDVRLPTETISTLKSVVTFPLLYPQSFKYGVLGQNSSFGVLLFGPPGTGKTMLAKAVAKECGACMIQVRPSDIEMKYVGESEKMVRALFTMARKKAPCVIFIDEIDALLSMRLSEEQNHKRDTINEFMMHWDGLDTDNHGIIIIGSTNRPFDLDEAVIRRLPQRILIDLPNEQDRLEILLGLLKDEELEPSVDFKKLAVMTEQYSGSDLKNLCVKAAILAMQDSIKLQNTSDNISLDKKKENNPVKRLITSEILDKALKSIGPSLAEGMNSLTKLRAWDEKFGSNRKKTKKTLGFNNQPSTTETLRVRPENITSD